ncbi:alpha/beta hydrolase [Paenibacillus soyae]|uniref:Esterase n=1 Tax=Paenibacillus soyae TaxID=2969249 RepID=A0A9X2MVS3_9BACL|nr:esterase [Paenibacillus soyae]MCR2807375.1 esterase [Paenibacillus soyae]
MHPAYQYDIQYPPHMDPEKKYPVVFMLHGKGSNEQNMLNLAAPLNEEFIIVGIRGNLRLGNGYQYYDLISLGNPVRAMFDDAVGQLDAFIRYATDRYPIDPAKRYVLGFSQGAILSMTLALTMGDQLRGIVALNGYVPGFVKTEYDLKDVSQVAMFVSHGQFDTVFPIRIGHETAAYLETLSPRSLMFNIYETDHGVSGENQKDFANWLRQDAGITSNKE